MKSRLHKITVEMDLDFALLRQQKRELSGLTSSPDHKEAELAEGMLNLLDHIQDWAMQTGQATDAQIWGKR